MFNSELKLQSYDTFESIKHISKSGAEFWYARELMPFLGYKKWDNFKKVIKKAKVSVEKSYPQGEDLFAEVGKKIKVGTGSKKEAMREIRDYKLTRHACYVIAQNGDPRKKPIAMAQTYFSQQTRKQEILEQEFRDLERIKARKKLRETEKRFSEIAKERGVYGKAMGEIRASGDVALFGHPTKIMKSKLGIRDSKPLADHLPTITLKAKDLATEISGFNTVKKNLIGKDQIKYEHMHNNSEIRNLLTNNGIIPEELPAESDIKKIEEKYEGVDNKNYGSALEIGEVTISLCGITDKQEIKNVKQIIERNPGKNNLKIIYGDNKNKFQIVRKISLNSEVFSHLQTYLI